MTPSSRLFATDMVSAGRVHYGAGEVFRFDHLVSEFRITIGGRLVTLDRLVATRPETIAALERLWLGRLHMAIAGKAFAYAPDLAPGVEDGVHEAIAGVEGTEAGVTRIGNLVIVRILSHETTHLAGPRGALQRPRGGRAPPCHRALRQDRHARPIRKC